MEKEKSCFKENQLRFMGNTVPTDSIRDLDTPIQYFLYSFLKILSKLYTAQSDINDLFRVSEIDIQQFIGLVYSKTLEWQNRHAYYSRSNVVIIVILILLMRKIIDAILDTMQYYVENNK